MTTKKNGTTDSKSVFVLPPDAKHFDLEDKALNPGGMFTNMDSRQTVKGTLLIVQPTSTMPGAQEKKNVGTIFNTRTNEFKKAVEIMVVVAPSMNDVPRAMKQKKFNSRGQEVYDREAPIICSSPNGIFPYEGYAGRKVSNMGAEVDGELLPDECGNCIFNGLKMCQPYYRYYALMINEDKTLTPIVFRLKGISFEGARRLNTMLQDYETAGEYWSFNYSSDLQPTRNGTSWYAAHFEAARRVTDAELLKYIAALNADYRAKQERILASQSARLEQIAEDARE